VKEHRRTLAAALAVAMLAGGALWWVLHGQTDGGVGLHGTASNSEGRIAAAPKVAAESGAGSKLPSGTAPAPEPFLQSSSLSTSPNPATAAPADRDVFTGWLIDQQGAPLDAHELAIFPPDVPAENAAASRALASAASARDGHFRLHGDVSGTVRLRVRGPGEGDLPVLVKAAGVPDVHIANAVEEGWIYLVIPDTGLAEATVAVAPHGAFWVTGRIELEKFERSMDDISAPPWWMESPQILVQDAATPLDSAPATRLEPRGAGPLVRITSPHFERLLNGVFLAPARQAEDRLLVARKQGYLTETREIQALDSQDVGTITLSRVAGFEIVVGGKAETITVRESGGDRPERVTSLTPRLRPITYWCDRRSGTCEISVTAEGGRHGTTSVELTLPGNELPQVLVPLDPP
jgi:hypothetical protein